MAKKKKITIPKNNWFLRIVQYNNSGKKRITRILIYLGYLYLILLGLFLYDFIIFLFSIIIPIIQLNYAPLHTAYFIASKSYLTFLFGIITLFSVEGLIFLCFKVVSGIKDIKELIGRIILIAFLGILIFSSFFFLSDYYNKGCLKTGVGDCIPNKEGERPTLESPYYTYFSAVTFFTLGYGDYVPLGLSRHIAMAEVFFGWLIGLVITAIGIIKYVDENRIT